MVVISANVADKLGIKAEEVEPTTFGGAVSETISKAGRVRLSPTEDTQPQEVIAFIKKDLSRKYGDVLLGLPAMISMGMTMETTPEEFILRFKKQGATLKVPHEGETKPVAATRTTYPPHWIEESQEDPGATVHPTRAQWEEKLQHVDGELKENLLDLLIVFAAQFWVSGYLPPIKNCRYTIDYRGPPFREPLIPLTKEDVAYVNDYFDDQIKQGLVVEVSEDTHRLPYVSNMFLKYEEDGKKRPCINYRKLNANTVKTNMPIPPKERLIATFSGADFYITTDCKALYTDRGNRPGSNPLTAPTGPAAPSQCPLRVRTGHPIIA